MPINYDKLNRKLNAINSKNVSEIVAKKVNIPFLGTDYTEQQLTNWLNKVAAVLENVRDGAYTDQQIQTFMTNVYNSLSASDKLIADKILANEPYELNASDADNYDKLRAIIIYRWLTT
jgi:nickel-dependent lactate racemase